MKFMGLLLFYLTFQIFQFEFRKSRRKKEAPQYGSLRTGRGCGAIQSLTDDVLIKHTYSIAQIRTMSRSNVEINHYLFANEYATTSFTDKKMLSKRYHYQTSFLTSFLSKLFTITNYILQKRLTNSSQ